MARFRHLQFKTLVVSLTYPKLSARYRVLSPTLQLFPKAGLLCKNFTWSLNSVIHKLLCPFSEHSNIHCHWCWQMQCSRTRTRDAFWREPHRTPLKEFTCSPSDTPRDGVIAAVHRTELTKALNSQGCSTVFTQNASRETSQINSMKWHWHITHTHTHQPT